MINKFLSLAKLFTLLSVSLLLSTLIAGCASTPNFDTSQVDLSLTPQRVVVDPGRSLGMMTLWGGTILHTANLQGSTRLEVLAYPLDTSQRPLLDRTPLGRFIILSPGYLETTSYAAGRLLTVLGKVSSSQSGTIGESTYVYPVINSEQIHLWSLDSDRNRTSFHFGVGIGL